MSNYKYKYYPKRPVKSFQDLEVYQKTYGLAAEIAKRVTAGVAPEIKKTSNSSPAPAAGIVNKITKNLVKTVLSLPRLIASAHSVRFGDSEQAIADLEKAMLNCNLAVYYLELYRDLANPVPAEITPEIEKTRNKSRAPAAEIGIDHEYFEEQIKEYLRVRGKIMRLQRSWLRFMKEKNV